MCENTEGVFSARTRENPNIARIIQGLEKLVHKDGFVLYDKIAASRESIVSQIVDNGLWIDGLTYLKIANLTQGELGRHRVNYEGRNYRVNILQHRQIGDGLYGIAVGMKSNRRDRA